MNSSRLNMFVLAWMLVAGAVWWSAWAKAQASGLGQPGQLLAQRGPDAASPQSDAGTASQQPFPAVSSPASSSDMSSETAGAASSSGSAQSTTGVGQLDLQELARASGVIGVVIGLLSVAMVALVIEHLLSIRRKAMMPPGLAESVHQHLSQGDILDARQQCKLQPSFLAHVLAAGLEEIDLGYEAVEKAMEEAAREQAARLFRKTEYLSVIGTLAPMLGLLGTVWGMILAFMEFERKSNPQVSELAPGIYKALVTTLLGLGVAVPALAFFAIFRNRIDELVAEASLMAERVFADYKRASAARRRGAGPRQPGRRTEPSGSNEPHVPPVAIERNPRRSQPG